jgi:ATP dependent DNA ligase domain
MLRRFTTGKWSSSIARTGWPGSILAGRNPDCCVHFRPGALWSNRFGYSVMARSAPRQEAAALPEWIRPQLTQLVQEAPDGPEWLHEIKFDGYRMHARLDRGALRLLTRTGLDWTHKYPAIAAAVWSIGAKQAYLDGELSGQRGRRSRLRRRDVEAELRHLREGPADRFRRQQQYLRRFGIYRRVDEQGSIERSHGDQSLRVSHGGEVALTIGPTPRHAE